MASSRRLHISGRSSSIGLQKALGDKLGPDDPHMIAAVSYLLIALASLLAIPAAILLLEITGALFRRQRRTAPTPKQANRPRVAVLIPAHNEGAGLRPTVEYVRAQLCTGDRLVVIADNCGDDTAHIAAAAGAQVIERRDPANFGKGYALDFGLKHLSHDPPEVVIIIDADCKVAEGTIHRLTMTCAETGRPAQALDLMEASRDSPINFRVAEFAWRVKNWVRPLGLAALNLPCQMMGTGMAIPWAAIRSVGLASESLVEDLELGLKLSQAGSSPVFCPSALVTSSISVICRGCEKPTLSMGTRAYPPHCHSGSPISLQVTGGRQSIAARTHSRPRRPADFPFHDVTRGNAYRNRTGDSFRPFVRRIRDRCEHIRGRYFVYSLCLVEIRQGRFTDSFVGTGPVLCDCQASDVLAHTLRQYHDTLDENRPIELPQAAFSACKTKTGLRLNNRLLSVRD